MTDRKIQLIGMGAGGIESLPISHKELILSADIIFGAKRHLEDIPTNIKKKSWSKNIRNDLKKICLLYTSPSPRDVEESRMPSSA